MLMKGIAGPLATHQTRYAERIDSNGKHLLGLINDILDISRIEAGKMPLHLERFDLGEVVREVAAQVEPLVSQSKVSLKLDLTSGLPHVSSDRQKVKQIVLNLLTNALKFTPAGTVAVRLRKQGAQLAVSVQDSGIGIDPKDHEQIFEDFRQADSSTTRAYGGAGLGLAICRRLATMLGGQITLHSALGAGSTFTLLLPRKAKRK
jgi:signal transduction histidine kinase